MCGLFCWGAQASVVVARGLSSCGLWAVSTGSLVVTRGLVALQHGIVSDRIKPVSPALVGFFTWATRKPLFLKCNRFPHFVFSFNFFELWNISDMRRPVFWVFVVVKDRTWQLCGVESQLEGLHFLLFFFPQFYYYWINLRNNIRWNLLVYIAYIRIISTQICKVL